MVHPEWRDRSYFFPARLEISIAINAVVGRVDLITEGGERELVGLLVTLESRHTRIPHNGSKV